MSNKIVCPNCGAENQFIGNCEFCGTPLEPIGNEVSGELHTKGVHRKLLNNSFLSQEKDEFGNKIITTPNCGSCNVGGAMTSHLHFGLLHEVQDNEEHLYLCGRSYYYGLPSKGKTLYISFGDSSLELHPVDHRKDLFLCFNKYWALYEITEDILLKICESSHLAFKLLLDVKRVDEVTGNEYIKESDDTESDTGDKFKNYARAFYNNLYDSTRYTDSSEKATKENSGCFTTIGKISVFVVLMSLLSSLL